MSKASAFNLFRKKKTCFELKSQNLENNKIYETIGSFHNSI